MRIYTSSGKRASTTMSIASAINSVLDKHSLSWANVVAISMDNNSYFSS